MVYGFVKQSHGHIVLSSEVARGTTVTIYLPRIIGPRETCASVGVVAATRSGHNQVVLLVEDDDLVRAFARQQVTSLGYRVIEAKDGPEALERLSSYPEIGLLFTDVVMRGGMSGWKLAEAAHTLRPGLPVLYTSGYTEDSDAQDARFAADVPLLRKPYLRSQLAEKLYQGLSQQGRTSQASPEG